MPHSNGSKPQHERRTNNADDTLKNSLKKYMLELSNRVNHDAPACLRCNYAPGVTVYCAECSSERTMTGNGEVEKVAPLWHTGPRQNGWRLSAALKSLYDQS